MSKQSIADGQCVRFRTKELAEELGYEFEMTEQDVKKLEGKKGKVINLATYTKLGDKDYEYYNVVLDNGIELDAISGYHLEIIK